MKKEFKNTLNEIKKISSKFPKTMNEALNFNDDMQGEEILHDEEEEAPIQTHAPHQEEMPVNNASEKARQLIDNIRKMSLRAMAELADNPEDENYIMLKKVWSMTDRKPEQEKKLGE